MGFYPKAIERLVTELGKLPGIGEKTAQRLAFHLIDASAEEIEGLSNALLNVKDKSNCVRSASASPMVTAVMCAQTPTGTAR